jgi:prepilin-type N-terminal cleavage/methylation domain-containing protein/prepilin-type processing-associated H-X9-DG protein
MLRRRGFTLVELLVVIAIIAILAGLLMSGVQKVRESGNRSKCINNMKQITLSLSSYEQRYNGYPPVSIAKSPPAVSPPRFETGLWIALMPNLDQDNVFKTYNFGQDWYSNPVSVIQYQPTVLQCPSNPYSAQRVSGAFGSVPLKDLGISDYVTIADIYISSPSSNASGLLYTTYTNTNNAGLLAPTSTSPRAKNEDIKDGLSNTIAFTEDAARPMLFLANRQPQGLMNPQAGAWADSKQYIEFDGTTNQGSGPATSSDQCGMNCSNLGHIYSFHGNGAVFGFADGSVRFTGNRVDMKILGSLVTRAGGETVSPDF